MFDWLTCQNWRYCISPISFFLIFFSIQLFISSLLFFLLALNFIPNWSTEFNTKNSCVQLLLRGIYSNEQHDSIHKSFINQNIYEFIIAFQMVIACRCRYFKFWNENCKFTLNHLFYFELKVYCQNFDVCMKNWPNDFVVKSSKIFRMIIHDCNESMYMCSIMKYWIDHGC